MGLGGRIAITGGAIIGAILLLAYVGNKTDILGRFTRGLTSIGGAIGQGVGGGLVAIPQGLGTAFGRAFVGTDAITGQPLDPLGLKAWYSDFLKSIGVTDPFQSFNDPNSFDFKNNPYIPNLSDSSILTTYQRQNADTYSGYVTSQNKKVPYKVTQTKTGAKVTLGGKSYSVATNKPSFKKGSGKISTKGGKTISKASARKSAAKKGKACFNQLTEMGGVERIDYRYPYM